MTISRHFEQLFGVSREEVATKSGYDIFSEEAAESFKRNDQKTLEGRRLLEFEEKAPHDDGEHPYISIKFPLHVGGGRPYAVCGISTDITDRKRDEELIRKTLSETQQSRNKIEAILSSVPHGLLVTDTEHRIVLMNSYAEKLLGSPLKTLFGRPVWEAIKGEDFLRHLEASLGEEAAEPVDLEL